MRALQASPASVEIRTIAGPHPGIGAATVRDRALKMVEFLGLSGELSIALVDDATIRTLNKQYRKKDKATDVLAFPMLELRAPLPENRLAQLRGPLGDVMISVPTAGRQARRHRRQLLEEVTMLLAHGILHLVGYDHVTDRGERQMTEKTNELVEVSKLRRPKSR